MELPQMARRVGRRFGGRRGPLWRVVEVPVTVGAMRSTRMAFPPGHFSSPIPSLKELRSREEAVFGMPSSLPGLRLDAEAQLALLPDLARLAAGHPFQDGPAEGLRYYFDNKYFEWGDGLVAFALLQLLRPTRVVEVGSGFSSALMLDTDELRLGSSTRFTFIDPNTERLDHLLRAEDRRRATVIDSRVQDVDPAVFDLEAGDLLFIDSSHVAKVGSDVNLLLLDILPALEPGVLVHIHDIMYPFEYPREWVFSGLAWNEAYVLRALLTDNPTWRILWFNSFLGHLHHDRVAPSLPGWERNTGGSLWLQRLPSHS